ncbi:MAG: hypothetical protein BMS9Abin26_0386 [Gammaproteobacteria bacterium]|nr:MAG: hypothetical protein BMS9Abin26_0386 [Gammaproteobacteria bacterium]
MRMCNQQQVIQGTSDLFMNLHLTSRISSFCVAKLRNSRLLRAIRALNLNILDAICFVQNKSEVP